MSGECYITNHFLTHFGRFFDMTISRWRKIFKILSFSIFSFLFFLKKLKWKEIRI